MKNINQFRSMRPRIHFTLHRADIEKTGACSASLAVFDALVQKQRRADRGLTIGWDHILRWSVQEKTRGYLWEAQNRGLIPRLSMRDERFLAYSLRHAFFSHADFNSTVFEACTGYRSAWYECHLDSASILQSNFNRANFTGGSLTYVKMTNSSFDRARFGSMNMDGITAEGTVFSKATFGEVTMVDARFYNCDFREALFDTVLIDGTSFENCRRSKNDPAIPGHTVKNGILVKE